MAIDLQKRVQNVGIVLEKKALKTVPKLRVGLAADVTYSMKELYKPRPGVMHETVARFVPLAMRFDDNGELDAWSFDTTCTRLPVATQHNYETFVQKEILDNPHVKKWGNTFYAPVMRDMLVRYYEGEVVSKGGFLGMFGKKGLELPEDIAIPAMPVIITDGANADHAETEKVIADSQQYAIFWQMVGVGPEYEFDFIKKMARKYPNVGFVNLSRLDISDVELYDQIISDKLVEWLKKNQA